MSVFLRWIKGHTSPAPGSRVRQWVQPARALNWAVADQIVVSGANFLTGVLLARFLGVEEFGRYVLAWVIILFVQTIQQSAVSNAMLSIGPKQDNASSAPFYLAMMIQQTVLGLGAAALTWICTEGLASQRPDWQIDALALPLASAVFFCQAQDFLRRYLFSVGQQRAGFLMDTARYGGQIALLVALHRGAALHLDTATVLWILTLAAAFALAVAIPHLPRIQLSGLAIHKVSLRNWQFSKWLIASAVLSWASNNMFYVVSGLVLGPAPVGLLRVAHSLIGTINILLLGLENVVPIQAARNFVADGDRGLTEYVLRVAKLGGAAVVVTSAILMAAPQWWLALLFGDAYRSSGELVWWMASCNLIFFFSVPATIWLRTLENTRPIFFAYAASSLVSVLIAFPLIADFGIRGAAIGMLIATVVHVGVLALAIKNDRRAYALSKPEL